jgi:hypothetical protein
MSRSSCFSLLEPVSEPALCCQGGIRVFMSRSLGVSLLELVSEPAFFVREGT